MLLTLIVLLGLGGEPEVARVRQHLAGAEEVLRAADISSLTAGQRARRAAIIDELAQYRARGQFPRNLDFAERTPYFIDERGVRCAMAHLIETFGGAALVARVAANANNAYVADLAGDRELRAWLDHHGLTLAEAARIQPTYAAPVGWRCSTDATCSSKRCVPSLDHPDELSYCSMPCDANTACPTGMQNEPMTCQLVGNESLCMYPDGTPGATGWPCDLDDYSGQCFDVCVGDRETRTGLCAEACPTSYCYDELACQWWDGREEPECPEPIAGPTCSVGGGGSVVPPVVVALLFAFRSRRMSRGGPPDRVRGGQTDRGYPQIESAEIGADVVVA